MGTRPRTGCTRDQEPRLRALGQTQHVQRSQERGLDRLYGIELIVRWGCWAGQVVNL